MFKNTKSTRSSTYLVPALDMPIQGAKLPSFGQVLGRLLHVISNSRSDSGSANLVAEEVLAFWNRARIPTQRKDNIVTAILDFHAKYKLVKKNKSRTTAKQQANEKVISLFQIQQP